MSGLYPILHTPFDAHGDVDLKSLRKQVAHARSLGVEGIVYPGFVSEWWRLSDDEVLACTEVIGRGFIGVVTPQGTLPAQRRLREFERMGAVGLMLLPPFVMGGAAMPHLEALLGSTSLPCIVQDSAGLTGTRLDASALAGLAARFSNLVGIKVDQVPTGPSISAMRSRAELRDLSYFAGYSGVQWWDASQRGATALMSGCGHIAADRAMIADRAGYLRMLPLLNFEMQSLDMVTAVHKRLLFEAGVIASPELRAPGTGLDAAQLEELRMLTS